MTWREHDYNNVEEPDPIAESVQACDRLHSQDSGHMCARPRGHNGYHQSRSGAIWIHKYIRYGKLDAEGQPLHTDGQAP